MIIDGRIVGPNAPCFIVAEISGNHMGRLKNALRLIDAAADAGADAVKFQCFTMDEILRARGDGPAPAPWQHYQRRELYLLNQTPLAWFPTLFRYARKRGLIPFSTVMGEDSLRILEDVGCPAYKIAKAEGGNLGFLARIAETGKPLIVSYGQQPNAFLWYTLPLYCPPGYPTTPDAVHLPNFGPAANQWGFAWAGLSSHCLLPELPIAAVARGAYVLEYHLMLEGIRPLDYTFSHTPESFRRTVDSVRLTEQMR